MKPDPGGQLWAKLEQADPAVRQLLLDAWGERDRLLARVAELEAMALPELRLAR